MKTISTMTFLLASSYNATTFLYIFFINKTTFKTEHRAQTVNLSLFLIAAHLICMISFTIELSNNPRARARAHPRTHAHQFELLLAMACNVLKNTNDVSYLFKCPGCGADLCDCDPGNHEDGGEGQGPANPLGPAWVVVVIVFEGLVVDQPEHHHGDQEARTDEFPTDAPVETGPRSQHAAHVLSEPIQSIKPGHGDRLEQRRTEQRHARRVRVQQMKHVDAALKHRQVIKPEPHVSSQNRIM